MTTRRLRGAGPIGLAACMVLGLAACDVTNPGQVLDKDLNSQAAMRILVNGMAGDFEVGLRDWGWDNAVLTGDLSGTSAYLSRQRHWAGDPQPEDADDYNSPYEARWAAEHGIERMKTAMGDAFNSSPLAAEAYVWAGFANRLLGEGMCQAVIDGGLAQDRAVYSKRAEDDFSSAIPIAQKAGAAGSNLLLAAYGGRASVRVILGEWPGAVDDAAKVPTDFVFSAQFSTTSPREINQIWGENRQRTNLSVKYTWFEQYYADYKDPRTPIGKDPHLLLSADGVSPHLIQMKYNDGGADIPLTKGTEMRLVQAENAIRGGDWQGGLAMINALRSAVNVAPWAATNADEAIDRLRKERAIVMWLEGRRGGDLLRFGGDPTKDSILVAMHAAATQIPLAGRAICSPFSQTLMLTNANLQSRAAQP